MTDEQRQFDFWVGRWTVTEGASFAGENTIELILGGRALLESWRGASGTNGCSISAYDSDRAVWHQTWVDTHGTLLTLEGGLVDGVMVLTGQRGPGGVAVRERIRWTPLADGTVRQHWDAFDATTSQWNTCFDGIYRRTR